MATDRSPKTPAAAPRARAAKVGRKPAASPGHTPPAARLPEPGQLRPQDMLNMQRSLGNQAALRLLQRGAKTAREAKSVQRGLPPGVKPGAGFEASADIEREISTSEAGAALPDSARRFMEPRLGADLSRVRVHSGPQSDLLNRDLGAQAFTHGSDIYFAEGKFDPGSTDGQKLLAHELTHTVQQGASPARRAQRTPSAEAIQASRQAAPSLAAGMLQLKRAVVSEDTTTRLYGGSRADMAKKIPGATKGKSFKQLDTLEISNNDNFHVLDDKGTFAWYFVSGGGHGGDIPEYIKADKVLESFSRAGDFNRPHDRKKAEAEEEGGTKETVFAGIEGVGELVNEADEGTLESLRAVLDKNQEIKEANKTKAPADQEAEKPTTGLTRAEGGLWLTAGLLGMASSLFDLVKEPESDAVWEIVFEKAEAGANLAGATIGSAGALAQIISTHYDENSTVGKQAAGTGAWLYGYQEMFNTLVAAIKGIKAGVDLVGMIISNIKDKESQANNEWIAKGGSLMENSLEVAKGVLRSIRDVNEAISGTVTKAFEKVLPPIEIAIAAVKTIMQGYYLIVSAVSWYRVKQLKEAERARLLSAEGHSEADIAAARKQYGKSDAKDAQLNFMIAELDAKIGSKLNELHETKDPEKKTALAQKVSALDTKKTKYMGQLSGRADAASGPSRSQVEELELGAELVSTNRKRVVRQSIHISTNLVNVAASIATLVSGPGAPAAIGLKAAATGIDMSLPFFRWIKQQGRNRAAKSEAKGEAGPSSKVFESSKSDAAKLASRKKHAVVMLKMVARLHTIRKNPDDLVAQCKRVGIYMEASGVHTGELFKHNGKPQAQINLLVKALKQRELSED